MVDSTKEIVTSAETRIAEAKVDGIHFGFDKFDIQSEFQSALEKK